jgi:hypothetical protein
VSVWEKSSDGLLELGRPPTLEHSPFGYAVTSTGGSMNASATYVVKTVSELKEALALPWTKTIYVQGVINGARLANGAYNTFSRCPRYKATS